MLFDKYTDSIDNHVQIKIKHLKNQVNERACALPKIQEARRIK